MDLVVTRMERRDMAACAEMLRGHAAYPDDALAELADSWGRLIAERALITMLARDRDGAGQPVVAFAASVFVERSWVEEAETGLEPWLGLRTLRAHRLGSGSPVIRPAGRDGTFGRNLSLINLHYAEAPGLADDYVGALRYRVIETFLATFRGYDLGGVWQEFWDEIDPHYIYNGWGRVRTQYEPYYERLGQPLPPMGKRPVLTALTREEALESPGNVMAPAFVPASARFGFTAAEKRLLLEAMKGCNDEELARDLNRALPTVKSQWRSIYRRVEAAAPGILDAGTGGAESRGRGHEKRRLLMSYIGRHPEEL